MKYFKFIVGFIIVGFIVLFIFQNQKVFVASQSFRIDLWFKAFKTQEIPNVILFLACFLIGFIVSYLFSLSERFKARKIIKSLHSEAASRLEEIAGLKSEVESFQSDASINQGDSAEYNEHNV